MKNHLFIFFLLVSVFSKAQNYDRCVFSSPDTTTLGTSSGNRPAPRFDCPATDGDVYGYIPNAGMPNINFRINYVFIRSSPGNPVQSYYSTISDSLLGLAVQRTVDSMNARYARSGYIPSIVRPLNPQSQPVSNPKIALVLNKIYRPVNDTFASTHFPPGNNLLYNRYNYNPDTAFNVYIYDDTIDGGRGWADFNRYSTLAIPSNIGSFNGSGEVGSLALHELGHGLGHFSDHYFTDTTQQYLMQIYDTDPASMLNAYTPSDAALDTNLNAVCGNIPTRPNNNIMGNSLCRQVFSARQIAAFHYLVAKGITQKYTNFAGTTYPYTPGNTPPTLSPVTLSGTQTLYGLPPFSVLTIQSGAKITIKNADVRLWANSKIVVEPGAKLSLNCVQLGLRPQYGGGSKWYGIEVWGTSASTNPTNGQVIGTNGLCATQGILEMDNCIITDAYTAVLAGKRTGGFVNNVSNTSGGGIIMANNITFKNNNVQVRMTPAFSAWGLAAADNISTFRNCIFNPGIGFVAANTPSANTMVQLEGVKGVKFHSNTFQHSISSNPDTTFCIRGYNSGIRVDSGNVFSNSFYGIYMTNGSKNTIEDNEFKTMNGIYISNSYLDKIVRNTIRLNQGVYSVYGSSLRTGIYMNESTDYKIENNLLIGANPYITEGMCINNTGPFATQVYNNTFTSLKQGIWCQNQNYDPMSATNDGLVINCNDFSDCYYNIGVQTPFVWMLDSLGYIGTYIYTNWQNNFSQYCFNGGIAETQGVQNTAWQSNTRNTYNSVAGSGNENKFYSYTPWSTPPVVKHGNFLDLSSTQFQVGPQPSYSDPLDVQDLIGQFPPSSKSSYCQDQSNLPAARPGVFTSGLSDLNADISSLNAHYISWLDNGSTQHLLDIINAMSMSTAALKDTLVAAPFLSDTVLTVYFSSPSIHESEVQSVFEKNAPVSKKVWSTITGRSMSGSIMAVITPEQNKDTLSDRSTLLSELSIARKDRSYTIMHKSMAFIDSCTTGVKDSLAALIVTNDQGDIARQLIELDFRFADYTAAADKLSSYTLANTTQQTKYVDFKTLLITVMQDSLQLQGIDSNSTWKAAFITAATDDDHPCKLEARNILFAALNTLYPEQKLCPQEGYGDDDKEGGRQPQNQTGTTITGQKIEVLAAGISFFPNPAGNEVFVLNQTDKDYSFSIMNVDGQLLIQNSVKAKTRNKIETGNLANGIYFVNLYEGKVLIKTNKLVIAR